MVCGEKCACLRVWGVIYASCARLYHNFWIKLLKNSLGNAQMERSLIKDLEEGGTMSSRKKGKMPPIGLPPQTRETPPIAQPASQDVSVLDAFAVLLKYVCSPSSYPAPYRTPPCHHGCDGPAPAATCPTRANVGLRCIGFGSAVVFIKMRVLSVLLCNAQAGGAHAEHSFKCTVVGRFDWREGMRCAHSAKSRFSPLFFTSLFLITASRHAHNVL